MHPLAPMYRIWNTLHIILMLYPVMVDPLLVAFSVKADALQVMARIIEAALLMDVIVTFFVAVDVGKTSDHLEQRPLHVAEHYIKSWFLFDLATSLPWKSILPLVVGKTWITETVTVREALDFLKIARYITIIRRNFYTIFSIQSMKYKQRAVMSFVSLVFVRP